MLLLILGALGSFSHAQRSIPEWRLAAEARVEIRPEDVDYYRVVGAALLPQGSLVIADAGNRRIVVLSDDKLIRSVGREGSGPGEVRWISALFAFGDTVLAYDPALNRVTTWLADGRLVRTIQLPPYHGHPTFLHDAGSPEHLLLVAWESSAQEGSSRLYTEYASLLMFHTATNELSLVAREPYAYHYFYAQESGSTTYVTPFFGTAQVAALRDGYAFIPLDSSVVEIASWTERQRARIRLPIGRRGFQHEIIDSYRDSLVESARSDPGSRGAEARLREFFSQLPDRPFMPAVRRILRIGGNVWVEVFPLAGDTSSTWYVVDPGTSRLRARVELPKDMTVLGGDDRSLIVITRDALDLEHLWIFDVEH